VLRRSRTISDARKGSSFCMIGPSKIISNYLGSIVIPLGVLTRMNISNKHEFNVI